MTKSTKSSKTSSVVPESVASIVTAPIITATSSSSVEKPVKEKKAKAPKVEAVSAAPVVITLPTTLDTQVATDAPVADVDSTLTEQSFEYIGKLQQLGLLISSLKTEYRNLEKRWIC